MLEIAKGFRFVKIIFVMFFLVSAARRNGLNQFFCFFVLNIIDDHSPFIHLQLVVPKYNITDSFSDASRRAKAAFLSSCIACRCCQHGAIN